MIRIFNHLENWLKVRFCVQYNQTSFRIGKLFGQIVIFMRAEMDQLILHTKKDWKPIQVVLFKLSQNITTYFPVIYLSSMCLFGILEYYFHLKLFWGHSITTIFLRTYQPHFVHVVFGTTPCPKQFHVRWNGLSMYVLTFLTTEFCCKCFAMFWLDWQ